MRISPRQILPGVIILGFIAGTMAFLAAPRTLTGNPTGPVPFVFPDQLGPYTGEDVIFCTGEQCARSYLRAELEQIAEEQAANPEEKKTAEARKAAYAKLIEENKVRNLFLEPLSNIPVTHCPNCGAVLSWVSLGEHIQLPSATPVFHKLYRREGQPTISVNMVFSGVERRSIHRPQVCLVAQGSRINNEYLYRVDNGQQEDFPLEVLEAYQVMRDVNGREVSANSYVYCYWLFNPERETPSHYTRFLHMLLDNCFRGYRPRWGYASISIPYTLENPEAWKEELATFLPYFYPLVTQIRQELDKQRNITINLTTSDGAIADQGTGSENLTNRDRHPRPTRMNPAPATAEPAEPAAP